MKPVKRNRIFGIIIGLSLIGIVSYIIFPLFAFFSILPDSDDVELDKVATEKFIVELNNYGKIFELDDCLRYTKRINGISIRMNLEESENEYGEYYKTVLNDQGINEKTFEKFRKFLEESKLRSYLKSNNFSLFIVDGFLDSSWGYLYNHSGENIEIDHLDIDGRYVKLIENLGDNWYRITSD